LVIQEYPEKILISIWAGLGDILFITPSLRILRKKFPKAKITVFSLWGGPGKSLLELNPYIDKLIYSKPGNFFKLARLFSKERYDIGIEMSFPIFWFFKLAKVKRNISFAKRPLWWIFPYGNRTDALLHASEQYLLAVDKVDNEVLRDDEGYDLFLSEEDRIFAKNIIGDLKEKLKIVLHPGARCNKNKRWDLEKIIELLKKIIYKFDAKIIIIGGEEDKGNAEIIKKELSKNIIDLTGNTTLRQTAAVMELSDIFIGHDSGPTHIASAFIPVVSIFASTNPANFSPLSKKTIIVRPKLKCSPCFHFPGYMNLFWGLRLRWINSCKAMDTISVEDVYKAVCEGLRKWKDY